MQRPSHNHLIAHTAKIVAKMLRRKIEKKIEDVLGEDQFGFRRGKGTRDVIGMLRIISERTLEIYSFIWCWNLDASSSRSEILGKFWNVVLEKDGRDQLDRSCEKWRSIRVKEQRNILHEISKRKTNWIGQILRRNCPLQRVIEGKIKGGIEATGRRGRRRRKLLDDLKERRGYYHLKEEDLDRTTQSDNYIMSLILFWPR